MKLYEEALNRNPRDLLAMTGLAQLWIIQKQPAQAVARIGQQIATVPGESGLYSLLGQVQAGMNDYAAAEQSFGKAVALNPNSVDAILALTGVQLARGSTEQAAASYQRAIQQDPRDVRPHILLGTLKESQGKWQEAQGHYEQALRVQPDNPAAANNLAYLLLEHGGNADVAVSLAQTARRALPEIPNTADTLAWAYVHKGVYGLAIDLLQEAVKASPNNPTYRYHLGVAYQRNKSNAEAKEQFGRALQLNPPLPQADEIRKALAENTGS